MWSFGQQIFVFLSCFFLHSHFFNVRRPRESRRSTWEINYYCRIFLKCAPVPRMLNCHENAISHTFLPKIRNPICVGELNWRLLVLNFGMEMRMLKLYVIFQLIYSSFLPYVSFFTFFLQIIFQNI
jgi:hypothetical protein